MIPKRKHAGPITLAGALFVLLAGALPASAAVTTKRVNLHNSGAQATGGYSEDPSISATGRFVAYHSIATNLVGGDTNGFEDVFVRDRQTNKTTRVSVRSNGAQANESSADSSLSADGRFVAFESNATNLVTGDTNASDDIFLRDRKTGKTTRVSVRSNGAQGDDDSNDAFISANGRYIAFESDATNLVAGDTNLGTDVFLHDRVTKKTTRVSVRSNGAQGDDESEDAVLSATGRFVVFESDATNLVTGDTNTSSDILVRDTKLKKTTRMSRRSNGAQGNDDSTDPNISGNGAVVIFESDATNLVTGDTNTEQDVFAHTRSTGKTRRVSVRSNGAQADLDSDCADISSNGRFVIFESSATNLVSGDSNASTDAFEYNMKTKKTRRLSVRTNGAQGDLSSYDVAISDDGRFLAFASEATNLVAGDTNAFNDIFVRGPLR